MIDEFRRKVLKLNETRIHKIRNSLGVYDSYKWIRKHKWLNIGRPVTEHEFYTIIRQVNNLLADNLVNGEKVTFPYSLGALELRKYDARIAIENGKIVTNLPIDWDKTLKLWAEDKEAYDNKILIKVENREIFKVYYNKNKAFFPNRSFYSFEVNRDIKRGLTQKIKNRLIDAFKLYG